MRKQIVLFLLLAVCSLGTAAQPPSKKCPVCGLSISKCQYKGKHPETKQQKKQISVSKPTGYINNYGYVDLGLSVKWSTRNVGASSESDYGGYYAWGETTTKDYYDWSNCFDCLDDKGESWAIYKRDVNAVITPSSGHDTARENWGGSWRMPTEAELKELIEKCQWKWTSKNGHNGYLVIGPNGNSIFLPAAGYRCGTATKDKGSQGCYVSCMISPASSDNVFNLEFHSNWYTLSWYLARKCGNSVRPVAD